MAAVLTGTPVAIAWGATANPAGQSITIPADATAVYMFWAWDGVDANGEGLTSATLNGAAPSESHALATATGFQPATGVCAWYSPPTGSQTLDVEWTQAPAEGPVCIVAFVKDGALAWGDVDSAHASSTTAVSVTLTTVSGDLVIKFDQRFQGGAGAAPVLTSGWTNGQTQEGVNGENARLSYISATTTTQVCASENEDYSSIVAVAIGPSTGASATIGQVTETDTAQPMTAIGPIVGTIGQASETNAAQPMFGVNFADDEDLFIFGDDEGDESSMGGLKLFGGYPVAAGGATVTIGQASESDTAQAFGAAQAKTIGQASETDSAQAVVAVIVRAIGQAQETDSAQAIGARLTQTIGQAAESDSAQPMAQTVALTISQATETDAAQPMTLQTAGVMGQASESDVAQALTSLQTEGIAQSTETDTAQALAQIQTEAIGIATETDSAQPVASQQSRAVGQAAETDVAQAMLVSVPGSLGIASETDAAQPLQGLQAIGIGQTAETDTAQPVALGGTAAAIGQASEIDAAQAFVSRLLAAIGVALETDAAQPFSAASADSIGRAEELDAALAMAQRQLAAIGIAVEFDTAQPMSYPGQNDALSVFWRYDVPAQSLRYDVPGLSLRYDVPSIGAGITIT